MDISVSKIFCQTCLYLIFSQFSEKFLCEFVSDEGTHTADIIFLKDAIDSKPVADLTRQMTEEPTLSYKAASDYKRVVLRPKYQADSDTEDSYDDIKDMVSKNSGAYFDSADGCFYKKGYSGNYSVKVKIGGCSQSYDSGDDDIDTQDVEIPEMIPEVRTLQYREILDGETVSRDMDRQLYIGDYATLNSSMKVATEDGEEVSESTPTLPVMLAFPYVSSDGIACGTVTAYDTHLYSNVGFGSHHQGEQTPRKIFDYSLVYNGEDGIYEKFYRQYDLLLRNSLQELKVKLLLSQSQKQNLPSYAKVVIRGVSFFFNKLKFTLGGKSEPTESELRTIALTTPVNEAESLEDMMPAMTCKYQWLGFEETVEVSENDYKNQVTTRTVPSRSFILLSLQLSMLAKIRPAEIIRKPENPTRNDVPSQQMGIPLYDRLAGMHTDFVGYCPLLYTCIILPLQYNQSNFKMIQVLLYPDALSMVGSMNAFEIFSTSKADVVFALRYKGSSANIVQHTYTPNDKNRITLSVKDIILPLLSFEVKDSSEPYAQPNIMKSFVATLYEVGSEGSKKEFTFSVIRAGVDRLSDSATNFLKTISSPGSRR